MPSNAHQSCYANLATGRREHLRTQSRTFVNHFLIQRRCLQPPTQNVDHFNASSRVIRVYTVRVRGVLRYGELMMQALPRTCKAMRPAHEVHTRAQT